MRFLFSYTLIFVLIVFILPNEGYSVRNIIKTGLDIPLTSKDILFNIKNDEDTLFLANDEDVDVTSIQAEEPLAFVK